MSKYKFQTQEFGVSETGIHLLRSNYNYETINYNDISLFEITKGKVIRNWILILTIGFGLIGFSIYYVSGLIDVFNDHSIHAIYIEEIVVPVLPFLLGGYCIFISMKTGIIFKIISNDKKDFFPLEEIIKRNELEDFINYLKSNKDKSSKLHLNIY